MLKRYSTEFLVEVLPGLVAEEEFQVANVVYEALESRGVNAGELLQEAFKGSEVEVDKKNERVVYMNPESKPTLKELRKQKGLGKKVVRLVESLDNFNLDDFIINRPWLFKIVDYFFDRYEVVEEEVEKEEEVVQEGNVYHVDFRKESK